MDESFYVKIRESVNSSVNQVSEKSLGIYADNYETLY